MSDTLKRDVPQGPTQNWVEIDTLPHYFRAWERSLPSDETRLLLVRMICMIKGNVVLTKQVLVREAINGTQALGTSKRDILTKKKS